MRAPAKKKRQRATPTISARLGDHITLGTRPDGSILACFDGNSVALGTFSAAACKRAEQLRSGLPLAAFEAGGAANQEISLLVRRLAQRGLLEYHLGRSVIIEPQVAEYWPRKSKLRESDTVVLSRFAYLRRRGSDMVLESSLAPALLRIADPRLATALARMSTPQKLSRLKQQPGFPGLELLALLLDCRILFKVGPATEVPLRLSEGDDDLITWDFHDLLFHTRSTEGRQANPLGGLYPFAGRLTPAPAVRPPWPGKAIELAAPSQSAAPAMSPLASVLAERHSTRDFDEQHPITLHELARFLDGAARIRSKWTSGGNGGDEGPEISYAARPYPSAGSAYELELYLAVANCSGLARGFYHYNADGHALTPITVTAQQLEAMLTEAEFAMGAPGSPQILIVISARFSRVSWKYSSVAYSLILKDVGVLIQTLYLMATDMNLGGCAIGTNNIELFADMTGLDFHVEGPVGQFALGHGVSGLR